MPRHYGYEDMVMLIEYSGNHSENLKLVLGHLDPDGSSNYDNWEDLGALEKKTTRCCCAVEIENVHSVRHKVTGDTLDIGSSCIGKFSEKMKKDANARVYRLNHPDSVYCAECNKTVSKNVVAQYQGVDRYFHKKCLLITFEKCENCQLFKDYNCKCERVPCRVIHCENTTLPGAPCLPCRIHHKKKMKNYNRILSEKEIASAYKIKSGKLKGKTLGSMLEGRKKKDIELILWLGNNNDTMKNIINRALKKVPPKPKLILY